MREIDRFGGETQTQRDKRDKRPVQQNLFRNISPFSFFFPFCALHVGSTYRGRGDGGGQPNKVNKNAQKRMDRKVASLWLTRVNKIPGLGVATP